MRSEKRTIMDSYKHIESPLLLKISFNKLLEQYEQLAKSEDEFIAAKAKRVLKTQEPYPELREGFADFSLLEKYKDEIGIILQDSFSRILTKNRDQDRFCSFSEHYI